MIQIIIYHLFGCACITINLYYFILLIYLIFVFYECIHLLMWCRCAEDFLDWSLN